MATNLARTLGALAAMMLGVVATAGCGPSPEKVVDLMAALEQSVKEAKKARKAS